MAEPTFTDGEIDLYRQNLTAKKLETVLLKMKVSRRDFRPRKCRRLEGFAAILAKLPPAHPPVCLDLSDNAALGDAGMEHLGLIPASVEKLILFKCGLTSTGVSTVCFFMSTNSTITTLAFGWDNFGDVGANCISRMLKINQTLRVLSVSRCNLSVEGFSFLSDALKTNHTLQGLQVGPDGRMGDAHLLALIPGLALNKGLKVLDLCRTNVTEMGLKAILQVLKDGNVHLMSLKMRGIPNVPASLQREINWWLQFNLHGRSSIYDDL